MTVPELSLLVGAIGPPLIEHTIGAALELAARRWPEAEALVSRHQGVRLSWAELNAATDAFAAGLLALGLRPGDRLAVWAPNCVEWAITQFATARAGIVQVNINPAYRPSELEYTLRKVGVKALVCATAFKSSDYVAMVETLIPDLAVTGEARSERLPDLAHIIKMGGDPRPGWLQFDDVAGLRTEATERALLELTAGLQANDPINIQFTSGTTGSPKGATLSHRNVLNNAYFVGLGMGLGAGDRLCIPVPLYHCFGMVMGNLACLVHGATMVYPGAGFDPLAVLQTVEAERCTALHGVPTMFIAQLEHPEFARFDLSSLRTGLMAGSPCPEAVMRKVMTQMHMRDIGIAYGMTETSPVSFQTAVDDSLERRVGTIGRVQPHLEVKIVDPATGEIVPRGQSGELCTRGYSVMIGYWGDPEKTADAIRDGWMHTGDLAVVDAEGYARIVGRIKDMIIRGGENIYPREIEEHIYRHPAVEDVQIIGVPDEKFGEEVMACVRLRAGETLDADTIIAFCCGQIAHYKVPRYVRFIDSFPMTVSGKVQKYLLREMMIADVTG
ncbi:AMP-binding protein [Sphingobium sp. JS3065]|uniref:AMP-binding protein n=1 Tax=Sphingobium sp. JS3065 TaxID=2970925 RepID=UPI002263DCC0|nr:AMP-binding protein [Sphingobium sp. JS3065]UZW57402.1 AMP-binding protein [Sphingobium sp. JS3065]